MTLQINDLDYDQIEIGQKFEFTKLIGPDLVEKFAELTEDYNPLHMDGEYAAKSEFGERVVHGMLMASFFSTLVGMICPGKRCLYLSQNILFKKHLALNRNLIVSGEVTAKFDFARILEIKTLARDEKGSIIIEGLARVQVRK